MPRVSQGGTKMWCANCKAVTVCAGINPSTVGYKSGQRWHNIQHTDVQWFRRGRRCDRCGSEFITSELREDFVDELIELRDALARIKKDAEKYVKDSEATTESLSSLTKSLGKLRALKIYKNQK
jgi:hypothetical protein